MNELKNFIMARAYCLKVFGAGYDLAVGINDEELKFLNSLKKNAEMDDHCVHLGISRREFGPPHLVYRYELN